MSEPEALLLLCLSVLCLAIGLCGVWVQYEGNKSAITTEDA